MATVLICDDEKDIVDALRIYLSSENYQLLTPYDGQQAKIGRTGLRWKRR